MKTLVLLTFLVAVAMWSVSQAADPEEPDCDYIGYSPFSLKQEICGSDGQTYTNDKHLEFENCLYRRHITKVKNGWCKEEDQKRAEATRKKFAEEQARRIHQASQQGK
ncbi:uncharacterized protein [Periplaneta americana]|uniref:uncharacterized protein n=1 Tax=Periplaneta americana TaxID=6978 RepID=UPI0037E88360